MYYHAHVEISINRIQIVNAMQLQRPFTCILNKENTLFKKKQKTYVDAWFRRVLCIESQFISRIVVEHYKTIIAVLNIKWEAIALKWVAIFRSKVGTHVKFTTELKFTTECGEDNECAHEPRWIEVDRKTLITWNDRRLTTAISHSHSVWTKDSEWEPFTRIKLRHPNTESINVDMIDSAVLIGIPTKTRVLPRLKSFFTAWQFYLLLPTTHRPNFDAEVPALTGIWYAYLKR